MELSEVSLSAKIKQHHQITSGRYDFTPCQLDIMFMLLATIRDGDEPNKEYHISVKDIELITKRKWNYQQLKDSTEKLMGRVYDIELEKGLKQIVLFNEVQYLIGTGSFYIVINPSAREYIFNLKQFTLLELKSLLLLTSGHAKRLYAIACQRRNMTDRDMPISTLKEMLYLKDSKGILPEQYQKFGMFKKNVLDIAKKQINEHTDIKFDYKLHKVRSRSYTHITLYCGIGKFNEQFEINFPEGREKIIEDRIFFEKISQVESYGISKKVATILATNNTKWKVFLKAIEIAKQDMIKGKNIEDKGAYIVGIIKNLGTEI
jgi:plasmid replication initiation protein